MVRSAVMGGDRRARGYDRLLPARPVAIRPARMLLPHDGGRSACRVATAGHGGPEGALTRVRRGGGNESSVYLAGQRAGVACLGAER